MESNSFGKASGVMSTELATPFRRIAAYALDAVISGIFLAPFLLGMRLTGTFDDNSADLVALYARGAYRPGFLAWH